MTTHSKFRDYLETLKSDNEEDNKVVESIMTGYEACMNDMSEFVSSLGAEPRQWLGYLVLCICSSAAGSLLILAIAMRKLRKLEDNPPAPARRLFGTTRKKRILQLFAHNSDAKPKTEEQTEKTANDITKK